MVEKTPEVQSGEEYGFNDIWCMSPFMLQFFAEQLVMNGFALLNANKVHQSNFYEIRIHFFFCCVLSFI